MLYHLPRKDTISASSTDWMLTVFRTSQSYCCPKIFQ